MRRTLDSVVAQTVRPALWVIVDDGSTDATPEILAEYMARHDWIRVVQKPDRGHRAVGPGVIEAFYAGLETIDLEDFDYLCKLDLDLDLPPRYFETLIERMEADPRIGTCSGKPYMRIGGALVSERRGDEMSAGMTKFYRVTCFKQIGGFVREVMWDAIDCHKARQMGWIAVSWDHPELRFRASAPHGLEPVGDPYRAAAARVRPVLHGQRLSLFPGDLPLPHGEPPYVTGGLSMLWGYLGAWARARGAAWRCRASPLHPRLPAPGADRGQGPRRGGDRGRPRARRSRAGSSSAAAQSFSGPRSQIPIGTSNPCLGRSISSRGTCL
jgi:biofilm PGA synthesis N-glycosyltransferase PgaC